MADESEISVKELRRAHLTFICKVYLGALGLVVGAIVEWLIIISSMTGAEKILKKYNFIMLGLIFLNFIMMLLIQWLLRSERKKFIKVIYTCLMVEIGSITLARPIAHSTSWLYIMAASVLTLSVVTVSLCISFRFHLEMEQEPKFLAMWTMKYFLTTSICLQITLSFDNVQVQISIAMFFTFFISIFIIIWGRSIGSLVYYREELSQQSLHLILAYLIFLSLFANALVLFQKI